MPRAKQTVMAATRLFVAVLFLFPLVLGFIAAFRPDQEMFRYGGELSIYTFIPNEPTLANFTEIIQRPDFLRQIGNTAFVGVVQSTLTVIIGVLAAFPLARMTFVGRDLIFFSILATMFVPFEAIVVPLFMLVRSLDMLNSYWGLILPWIASPIAVFLLRQSMQELPRALDEAAIIDGANLWHLLRHVVVPNIFPAMVTVWIITFMYIWDSFLWPLVIINDPELQMVQIGISSLFNPERIRYGLVFAGSVLAIGPVLGLFLLLQRFYQRSVALTGIK